MSFIPQACPQPLQVEVNQLDGWATSTTTVVPASLSSTLLAVSNPDRRYLLIHNDSSSALMVYFGSPASSSLFTVVISGNGSYEWNAPVYTGIVTGVWGQATGQAMVTEGST